MDAIARQGPRTLLATGMTPQVKRRKEVNIRAVNRFVAICLWFIPTGWIAVLALNREPWTAWAILAPLMAGFIWGGYIAWNHD